MSDLETKCRRLIQAWRKSALTLEGAFECDGYARVLRSLARELEALLPRRSKEKK